MDHPHDPLKHMWRTLVRIERVTRDTLIFSLPGESRKNPLYEIALIRLPTVVRDVLMVRWMGTQPYLHVHTNLGQERKARRKYSGWEPL